jgi:hypothetical protein
MPTLSEPLALLRNPSQKHNPSLFGRRLCLRSKLLKDVPDRGIYFMSKRPRKNLCLHVGPRDALETFQSRRENRRGRSAGLLVSTKHRSASSKLDNLYTGRFTGLPGALSYSFCKAVEQSSGSLKWLITETGRPFASRVCEVAHLSDRCAEERELFSTRVLRWKIKRPNPRLVSCKLDHNVTTGCFVERKDAARAR